MEEEAKEAGEREGLEDTRENKVPLKQLSKAHMTSQGLKQQTNYTGENGLSLQPPAPDNTPETYF